ncbi:MAG: response regulator transcription factor [Amphritea sp.]
MQHLQSAVIAHRYPLDRLAMRQIINQQNPEIRITEAISMSELRNQLNGHQKIDLLLLDLALLKGRTLKPFRELLASQPALKAVTISHDQQNTSNQLLHSHGVAGNISSKDSRQTIINALHKVANGKCWFPVNATPATDNKPTSVNELSRKERRVLRELMKGLMNKQIAYELKISPNTVKAHVCSILRKFGVNNRTQAVLAYSQQMTDHQSRITA